jgi:hypothetical protein
MDGGSDAVDVVREFLVKLDGRVPTRSEVVSIGRELEELERRVLRLRAMAPAFRGVELGEDIQRLLRILREKRGGLRSAASFL